MRHDSPSDTVDTAPAASSPQATVAEPSRQTAVAGGLLALLRIMLGFIMFWTFIDKIFGLGIPTPSERSVLSGASATSGYLSNVDGPLSGVFTGLAGQTWVDVLYLLAFGACGVALLLGIGLRLAAIGTVAIMVPLALSALPLDFNPLVDQHLVYAVLAVTLAVTAAGDTAGFGRQWARSRLVRTTPWLR